MRHLGSTNESSLLLTLEEISQLVAHSHDLGETLVNIVRLIQGRFHTDVCSVYLLEPDRSEVVLGATVGLRNESIGCVRMRLDEGLTGLVAEKMAPVMVDDAFRHPRFKYFPEAGEDPYHSFLGVPLVEGGTLQGVLVVQTLEARSFSTDEVRLLIAVAAQLAPLVSGSRLFERIVAVAHKNGDAASLTAPPAQPASVCGISLSPGIVLGQAYRVNGFRDLLPPGPAQLTDPDQEKHRLATAMTAAQEEISRQSQRISALVGEDHGAILQAQLLIMQDRAIDQDLTDCLHTGLTAEAAVIQTLDKYVAAFQKVATPFFLERIFDIKDIFRRILWHLQPQDRPAGAAGARLVLVAHEASVMDLFAVDLDRLAAVVVEHGGPQSHVAILARSLGIPMVGQAPGVADLITPGQSLLVDATCGTVYLDPTREMVAAHPASSGRGSLPLKVPAGTVLPAGLPRIEANVNFVGEVGLALAQGAAGVGLYRSEFLFLARRTFPTEEEQVGIYRKLLGALGGRPATIRTFDLRSDKLPPTSPLASRATALDWRQVLVSPPLQQIFKDQVRAILRAAALGPARILVPMVTRSEQLDFVVEAVEQVRRDLRRDGLEWGTQTPLGIMIEVAAAAPMVATWADQVDFFALGTNDLAASALGFDRDDPSTANANDPLHPGLLRLICDAVNAAHKAERRITVCGEMAADPAGVLALAALQVDALSVAVNHLDAVRFTLLERSPTCLPPLARELANLRTADEVRDFMGRCSRPTCPV